VIAWIEMHARGLWVGYLCCLCHSVSLPIAGVVINVERFAHGAIHEIEGSARGFLVSLSMGDIYNPGA